MKVLYLDTGYDSSSEYFRRQREKVKDCTNQCLYKRQTKGLLEKIILAIGIYVFPPVLYMVYGDWKKELDQYDVFIVVSRKPARYAIRYIRKKTNKRVIVWYWNLATDKEMDPDYCRGLGCETWSFDKNDCEKYQMKFGDTYYFPPQDENQAAYGKILYHTFYVGINRPGRQEFLNHLGSYLDANGLTYRFNLTAIPTDPPKVQEQFSRRMSYEEIIETIQKSDSVLDLNRENQSGMTLRPLEALFFQKKLLTNNKDIVRYHVYDETNTYILKDDQFEGLSEFLRTPYKESIVHREMQNRYSFQGWLDRILSGEEAQ